MCATLQCYELLTGWIVGVFNAVGSCMTRIQADFNLDQFNSWKHCMVLWYTCDHLNGAGTKSSGENLW